MHESVAEPDTGTAAVAGLIVTMRDLSGGADDAVLIDQIRALEELKSAAAATQARLTASFATSQRQAQLDAGVPAERAERGIASQIGLAQWGSPANEGVAGRGGCRTSRPRRYLRWAKILTTELPATFAQLQAGKTSEWRAMLVARETLPRTRQKRSPLEQQLIIELRRHAA